MPSQGLVSTMFRAASHTLMRKLLELSSRPATRLSTRTRRGSTWVTSTTSAAAASSNSSTGNSRRHRAGQWRVWRMTSSSPSTPNDATMPIQAPRL